MNPGKNKIQTIGMIVAALAMLTLSFAASYGLSGLGYRLIGSPPPVFANVISGFLGLIIFVLCMMAFRALFELIHNTHVHGESGKKRNAYAHHELLQSTVDAIERIAQGDFTALIQIDRNDPYSELAQSVNKMARGLGSMESLRQEFISNVSHEIQSPLTSIRGFAALLKDETLPIDQRTHYLNVIETESKRLSSLSDNLLKLSSLEADNKPLTVKAYRLDKQLESIALMLEPQWAEKRLFLEAELDEVTIAGDENLLSEVWINLLHNAIKFTPAGGNIRIRLTEEDTEQREIICRIEDTGIGIAPEDKIHLFERFYKVDKSRSRTLGGNGLGLSLVKKIVELHNGKTDIESEPNKGTTFIVHLPQE
jgi:signal transduction histidine kinase